MYGFNTPAVLIRTGIGEVLSPGDKCRDADQSVGMLNAECCPVSYRELNLRLLRIVNFDQEKSAHSAPSAGKNYSSLLLFVFPIKDWRNFFPQKARNAQIFLDRSLQFAEAADSTPESYRDNT